MSHTLADRELDRIETERMTGQEIERLKTALDAAYRIIQQLTEQNEALRQRLR